MLLKHTLLYLPAQFVGPLFQLLAMIVWTHVVDEHTLGVITLICIVVVVATRYAISRYVTRSRYLW